MHSELDFRPIQIITGLLIYNSPNKYWPDENVPLDILYGQVLLIDQLKCQATMIPRYHDRDVNRWSWPNIVNFIYMSFVFIHTNFSHYILWIRLEDISTPEFSTPESSTPNSSTMNFQLWAFKPWTFEPWTFNHKLLNHELLNPNLFNNELCTVETFKFSEFLLDDKNATYVSS